MGVANLVLVHQSAQFLDCQFWVAQLVSYLLVFKCGEMTDRRADCDDASMLFVNNWDEFLAHLHSLASQSAPFFLFHPSPLIRGEGYSGDNIPSKFHNN